MALIGIQDECFSFIYFYSMYKMVCLIHAYQILKGWLRSTKSAGFRLVLEFAVPDMKDIVLFVEKSLFFLIYYIYLNQQSYTRKICK